MKKTTKQLLCEMSDDINRLSGIVDILRADNKTLKEENEMLLEQNRNLKENNERLLTDW